MSENYSVYLTIYSGKLLPPFYIGYVRTSRIKNGYNGSVKSKKYRDIFEAERKLNGHLFKTKIIAQYSTRDEAKDKETKLQSLLQVHRNPLYMNLAISYSKFYCDGHTEESRNKMRKPKSDIAKKNMSAARKLLPSNNKGKRLSADQRKAASDIKMGLKHSDITKQRMSESRKKYIIENDTIAKLAENNRGKKTFRRNKIADVDCSKRIF